MTLGGQYNGAMADVRPFRGIHFDRGVVGDLGAVLAPPYDVIDAAGERSLLDRHPNNVVRIELTTVSVGGGPAGRYAEAAATLAEWRSTGILVHDDAPVFYLHEANFALGSESRTRRELFAAVRLEPWDRGVVLPHEHTFDRPKADRLRLLEATETNLSPVLSFFRREPADDDAVESAWRWADSAATIGEGTDAEGVRHRLWALPAGGLASALTAFFADRPLFIADGHHRYETALGYLDAKLERAGGHLAEDDPARFVLMSLIAEDDRGLAILPLHRLLRHVPNVEHASLLGRLRTDFQLDAEEQPGPISLSRVTDLLAEHGRDGQALYLYAPRAGVNVLLRRSSAAPLPAAISPDRDESWRRLDVVLADAAIVRPILGAHGADPEDALEYARDAADAIARVDAGDFDLALLVNPTRVDQIAAVALAGERMPEKSTYFYPKAPTGLVFRSVSES